jgi:hypothetical protein
MVREKKVKLLALYVGSGLPLILSQQAFAATGDINNVESFIKSVITVLAALAGLIATGFFVLGGLTYITSSGNPRHLEKAKRTLFYSGLGLAITLAAFVLSNIVTTLATNAFGS